MSVREIHVLNVSPFPNRLVLRHPVFRVSFNPRGGASGHDVVDPPTFDEAKELAESYYAKWSKVNHKKLAGEGVNQ